MATFDEGSPAYWLELYSFCFSTIKNVRGSPPDQAVQRLLPWFTKLKDCGDEDKAGAVAFLLDVISFHDAAIIKETSPRTDRMLAAIAKLEAMYRQIRTQEHLDEQRSKLNICVTAGDETSPENWNAPAHDANSSDIDVSDPFLELDLSKEDPLIAAKKSLDDGKPDEQKLVKLNPMGSEQAKRYLGTEWKNAQFVVSLNGKNEFFPSQWNHKDTGCTIRAKVLGGNIAKRLRFHVQYRNEQVPSADHDAYLEFFESGQVQSYVCVDKTSKRPKKDQKRDSYFLVKFASSGGIGYGLDYTSDVFDDATKNTFKYLQSLCINYAKPTDSIRPARYINLRINAHFFHDDDTDRKDKRRISAFQFARDCFLDFAKEENPKQPWDMYRNLSGQPQTQWNQWISRKVIHEGSGGLIKYPAFVSFPDLSTAAISLCYGAFLEWKREKEIYSEMSKEQHEVAFVRVAEKGILAVLKFAEPKVRQQEAFRLKDGDLVRLSFRPPGKATAKHSRCAAMAIPDMFSLPYGTDSLLLVLGNRLEFFESFAVEVGQKLRYIPATVIVNIPEKGAQRQIDAVNRLCGMVDADEHLQRWRKVFLNQHSGKCQLLDPTRCLDKSDDEVNTVIESTIAIPNMTWSDEQIECLKSCRSFPEGMLLVQGFPGAGKTYTLVAMARIFLELGMHVVFSTPTHYAADAICETVEKYNKDTGFKLDPLRVYRENSEVHAWKSRGIVEDQYADRPSEHDEFGPLDDITSTVDDMSVGPNVSVGKDAENIQLRQIQRGFPTINEILADIFPESFPQTEDRPSVHGQEDTATSEPQDSKFEAREYSQGTQLQMIELAQSIRKNAENRCYGLPRLSLEARAVQAALDAEASGEKLIDYYPSAEQIAVSRGIPPEDAYEAGSGQGEEADMFAELRKYLQLMQTKPINSWDEEDRRKSDLSFKKVCQYVMSQASLIVSTNNNLGSSIPARHFGKHAKGIILIRDEDPKEVEPNGWIPLAKMDHANKVQGIILCGDLKQLQPTVISAKEDPGWNEFSLQLETSFAARLIKTGHPVLHLTEQRRFRPVFVDWLNERVYAGKMRSHSSTASISVNERWSSMMSEFLPINSTASIDMGYLVLSPNTSECVIEPSTKSRMNASHVDLVMELILRNHQAGGYRADEITIISPYKAQNILYRQRLFALVADGKLPPDAVPSVATIDSQQGKESKVVILDWVVSNAQKFSDIGFTADDNRGNVAHSRMKEVLINILPLDIASGQVAMGSSERLNSFGEIVTSKVPYVCDFAKWASGRRIGVQVGQESSSGEAWGHDETSEPSSSQATAATAQDPENGKGKEALYVWGHDETSEPSSSQATVETAQAHESGKGKEVSTVDNEQAGNELSKTDNEAPGPEPEEFTW
ncbi:predicted protein [Paecilomyces variotii No. 5]|uniref:DNA2/NAM7 helicase-like C-terminal domain-containing protein n=1 Tax=Byssochlamys spectabilis (strain No. 5 / NBRC 109023) TaxID=1356009 RepID=V5GH72_BYSSN|nr:predicted protein [Paecilomyces variotii No. 5]